MSGVVEIRGIVNKDGTISYGEFTQYDNEFGRLNLLNICKFLIIYTFYRLSSTWTDVRVLSRYVQGVVYKIMSEILTRI